MDRPSRTTWAAHLRNVGLYDVVKMRLAGRSVFLSVSPEEVSMTEIVIINKCSVLSDDNVQAVIPALQAQISEDFAPICNARR